MVGLIRNASVLAVALWSCTVGPTRAADEPLSREAIARRAKASTALVEVKPSYGSGFCVHSSGLFVTNEHVVRQAAGDVTLVLDGGLKTQRVVKAKVLRRDRALDLALLKVDGDEKIEALELGSDKDLNELTELIACGFPFGAALARPGEYPAISINVGSVTSLRRDKAGDLHRIQLDAAVNPGNSGGPVFDRSGKVVGVVVSGIRGSGVNQAIPVSHLQRFLAQPEVILTLPDVKDTNRHEAFEFTAKTIWVLPTNKTLDLELLLSDGPGKERRFPMKLVDGTHRATATPFPAREGAPVCRLDAKYEDGSVSGTAEDRTLRIGDKEFKLSQLRKIRLGPAPEVQLADGQRLNGKPDGLEDCPLKVGKQSLRLDLAGAAEVNVAVPEEATVLYCTVVARQKGEELVRHGTPLYIAGVSQPNSPADWTKGLKKMAVPDGPVAGTILGADFKADKVQLQNTGLHLQSGRDNIHIFLTFKPGKDVYEYKATDPKAGIRPAIHVHILSTQPPSVAVHQQGYDMRLEFGKEKDGKIPCKLYLCLPDDSKSCIAGTFTLDAE
jgi:hypothetical protein